MMMVVCEWVIGASMDQRVVPVKARRTVGAIGRGPVVSRWERREIEGAGRRR